MTQTNSAQYIGLDKFQNYRFRVTSEGDAKSMTAIAQTNVYLKLKYSNLYSPVYCDNQNDFGLITVHRATCLEVEKGCFYSFKWETAIAHNRYKNNRLYVKLIVDDFKQLDLPDEIEDEAIPLV